MSLEALIIGHRLISLAIGVIELLERFSDLPPLDFHRAYLNERILYTLFETLKLKFKKGLLSIPMKLFILSEGTQLLNRKLAKYYLGGIK